MSGQHTQGRLVAVVGGFLCDERGTCMAATSSGEAADARRLAACWNAFDGAKTDDIEHYASLGGVERILFDCDTDRATLRSELAAIKAAAPSKSAADAHLALAQRNVELTATVERLHREQEVLVAERDKLILKVADREAFVRSMQLLNDDLRVNLNSALAAGDNLDAELAKRTDERDAAQAKFDATLPDTYTMIQRVEHAEAELVSARTLLADIHQSDTEARKALAELGMPPDEEGTGMELARRVEAFIAPKPAANPGLREFVAPLHLAGIDVHGIDGRRPVGVTPKEFATYEANAVVGYAERNKLVLTITQRPRQPLAMGNYETVVEVRPARERAQ